MWRRVIANLFLIVMIASISSCGQQDMADEGRIKPFEPDPFFKDGSSARPLVEGTVARGHLKERSAYYTGRKEDYYAVENPLAVDRKIIEHGREIFTIYCTVCHSQTGDGDGIVVRRGFTAPPSFHTERLRKAPPGYIFAVISNGTAKMPSYSDVLDEYDRWAAIAYLKTLQRSRQSYLNDAPAEIQTKLKNLPADEEGFIFEDTPHSPEQGHDEGNSGR